MIPKQRIWLYGLYGAAAAYLLYLLSSTQLFSFYSGDAGLKLIMIKQICASEDFRYLANTHPGWVNDIWAQGYFPILQPFVFHTPQGYLIQYPIGFQYISAFFYKHWGYTGLYVVPLLSLLVLWYWFIRTALKLSFSPLQTGILFFIFAFCSPLSLYGVVYWEHTLAMLLLFGGIYYFVYKPRQLWQGFLLGVLSGLSAWLRPESMLVNILLLVAIAVLNFRKPVLIHWLFALGVLIGTSSFLLFNKVEYGYFFGAHGLQVLAENTYFTKLKQITNIYKANLALIEYFPVVLLLIPVFIGWLLFKYPLSRTTISLLLICAIYCCFSLYMFPNDGQIGGKQWGPRYLLPVVPIIILVIANTYKEWKGLITGRFRWIIAGTFVLVVAGGFTVNTVAESIVFRNENFHRVSPAVKFALRDTKDAVIVVNSHFVTMEMGALYDQKNFFLASDTSKFNQLIPLLKKNGIDHFLYINHGGLPEGFSNELSAYGTNLIDVGSYKAAVFSLKDQQARTASR